MKYYLSIIVIAWSTTLGQIDQIPSLTLEASEGESISLEKEVARGPMLIDFWALWCAPCLKAMRFLNEFEDRYRDDGFRVLAINLDTERSRSKVRNYVRSKGYDFLVAFDPSQESFRRMNGNSLPFTLLVDRTGTIVYRHVGYVPGDEKKLEKEIQSLLSSRTGSLPQFAR
ncbi:MAG: TlpA disulfide reductase family protein [Candidatus Neomarinimicrobiota bacterium]